jgi:uncharacterized circularly permuted ATP-grasp superfamily protein
MSDAAPVQFDEMFAHDGTVRPAYASYRQWLEQQDRKFLNDQHRRAESFFRRTGITFNVYGEEDAEERLIPFDMIPRIVTATEWRKLSRGIEQRVRALNAFLNDIYHRREIVRAGILPERGLAARDGRRGAAWRHLYPYCGGRSGPHRGR